MPVTQFATPLQRAGRLARQARPVVQLGARRMFGRKSPFQITFSLTNRCNFRCEYCEIPLQHREEMSVDQWRMAIDDFRRAGMGRASLIGGEPLLHKDVGPIIQHLRHRGIHTAMNTNGWLVPDRIEDVARLDLVCLTLDGPPEVHDGQRRQGSYARVIKALDLLHAREIPVVTMTVVTPRGLANLDHVLDVAEQYGHKAFFQIEHDKACDVYAPLASRLPDASIRELAETLMARKAAGKPVGNSKMILERQRDHRYLGTCADCYAGQYYGYVMSDGTVAPCLLTQWQQTKANGLTRGFARAFQELAQPKGPGCSCVPTHEVNHVFALNLQSLWHAVEVSLGSPPPN